MMKKIVFFIAMLAIASVSFCTYGQELKPVKGLNGKWGYIDKKCKVLVPFIYYEAGDFSEGLVRVKNILNRWGFIDKTGKEIIPFIYFDTGDFSEGIVRVKNIYNIWGFIDKTGKEVIKFEYNDAKDFYGGQAQVNFKGDWIYIDKTGKEVIQKTVSENKNIDSKDNISSADVITLLNGEVITAKITEISMSEIKYKRIDNLEGPNFTIPRANVFAINYANGAREVINPINNPSNNNREAPAKQNKIFLGGTAGFDFDNGKYKSKNNSEDLPSRITYQILPKIGFYIGNNVALGIEGGYTNSTSTNKMGDENIKEMVNGWQIGAFTRFNIAGKEKLSLILNFGGYYGESKSKSKVGTVTNDGYTYSFYTIGALPVLSYNLSDRLSVDANFDFLRIGFQSWSLKNAEEKDDNNTFSHFGLGLNSNNYSPDTGNGGFVSSPFIRFGIIFKF